MASTGQIPAKIINDRGDRLFCVHELLSSETMPQEHKNTLLTWYQSQFQDKHTVNNPDLHPLFSVNLPDRIKGIVQTSSEFEITDPWQDIPESCRDEGFRRYKIIEKAREIKSSFKKGRGRTKILSKYSENFGITPKTLYRWIKSADNALASAIKDNSPDLISPQIKSLTPKHGQKKNFFHSWSKPALNFALETYLKQGCPNITDTYKIVLAMAAVNSDWKIGSYDSLVDAIGRINKATVVLARQGKKKFRAGRVKKILRNYEEIPPNFMWCGDHHIFDIFVKVQDSKGGWKALRPWITAWMDVRSRSLMGWVISFNPNSQTIAMALAHGISDKNDPNFPQHGLPNSTYVDNGKDYRAERLNGKIVEIGNIDYPEIIEKFAALGIDPFYIDLEYDPESDIWKKKRGKKEIVVKGVRVGGVYATLGIGHRFATVYSPWAKLIERFFRNVVQSFSRSLPGWCGSTPDQRPEKLANELKTGNILTLEEFIPKFYNYITNVYHKSPHRGHGMNNRTPDEVFQALLPQPKKVSQDLLNFALAKKERVKIHNWGFVINNREFQLDIPSNIYGGHVANHLIGEWAQVFYDYDFKTVRVFKSGKFICNGKPLQRASYVDPDCPVMVEGLKLQANQMKAAKAVLDAIHGEVEANKPVSESRALLNISRSLPFPDSEDTGSTNATLHSVEEQYIPIDSTERYQMILDKIKSGQDLSDSDSTFKSEYEKTDEYLSYQHLFTGTMDK